MTNTSPDIHNNDDIDIKTSSYTNKQLVSLYNKYYNHNKKDVIKRTRIFARKISIPNCEWQEFSTQSQAAQTLGLFLPNISKVLHGHLNSTGGYTFKKSVETIENTKLNWESIKREHNIVNKVKNQQSSKRILHTMRDSVIGKICCTCKLWKELSSYNLDSGHWDSLRNECKDCISIWRINNRPKLAERHKEYERKRKKSDPEFKIMKTLRSRLNNALKRQDSSKCKSTIELTGCSITFLKSYLEERFTCGMSWSNHGEWHIDHIKPCCKFNLLDVNQQVECFHYTNLQPLWAIDNLKKGDKYDEPCILVPSP
jgi:hypothetical protein